MTKTTSLIAGGGGVDISGLQEQQMLLLIHVADAAQQLLKMQLNQQAQIDSTLIFQAMAMLATRNDYANAATHAEESQEECR